MSLIKDHVFGKPEVQTIEVCIFRCDEFVLNKTKVSINIEKGSNWDFDISDEVQGLDIPYLYFLNGMNIHIVSMLTSKEAYLMS